MKLPAKLIYLALISILVLTSCSDDVAPPTATLKPDSVQITVRPTGGQVDARVVSKEVIPQNNCGGTSTVTNSIERSLAVIHTVEMGGGLEVSAGGGVGIPGLGKVDVGAAVSAHYGQSFGTQSSLSRGIQVSAKEGTFVEHTIQIKEVWQVGEVEIQSGDQVHVYPFKFRNDMSLELVESENLGCDPSARATRAAQATPTFTPVPVPTSAPSPTPAPTKDTSSHMIPTPEPTPTDTPLPGFARYLTVWGSQGSGIAQFDNITGLAVDSLGDLYVADEGNGRIQKFSPDSEYLGQIKPENGVLVSDEFSVAIDKANNIYFVERKRGGLVKYSPDGKFLGVIDPLGTRGEGYRGDGPRFAAFSASGNIYLTYHEAYGYDHLVALDANGQLITKMQLPDYRNGSGSCSYGNLAVGADETVYICGYGCGIYPASLTRGLLEGWSIKAAGMPRGGGGLGDAVTVGPDGRVYTVNSSTPQVNQFSPQGKWISSLDISFLDDGRFYPYHIAISPQGTIYIATRFTGRIAAFEFLE